jgi:hypothetical protein
MWQYKKQGPPAMSHPLRMAKPHGVRLRPLSVHMAEVPARGCHNSPTTFFEVIPFCGTISHVVDRRFFPRSYQSSWTRSPYPRVCLKC